MSNASHSPKISDLHGPVFDAIPDMFVLYDKDHTILDILHPKPELMSDRPEAFIGKSMTEERLKQVVGANYHQLEAVISTQKPSRFVFRHKGYRSGKILYYEVYLSWLEAGYVLADHPHGTRKIRRADGIRAPALFLYRSIGKPRYSRVGQKHGYRTVRLLEQESGTVRPYGRRDDRRNGRTFHAEKQGVSSAADRPRYASGGKRNSIRVSKNTPCATGKSTPLSSPGHCFLSGMKN